MTVEKQGRVAIRTPDQRLRVFVSSTLAELAEERAAVARAISALRLTPVLFELGARPHAPRVLYIKAPAPDREERLTAMIRQLQTEGTDSYRSFRSARELGRLVRDDL